MLLGHEGTREDFLWGRTLSGRASREGNSRLKEKKEMSKDRGKSNLLGLGVQLTRGEPGKGTKD